MKLFSRLNKMTLLAFAGLVIGGCGFFGDLFGVVDSTNGKFGEGQSVCNNIDKDDIFPRYYGGMGDFRKIGDFVMSGKYSIAQIEKKLGAQIHYIEIKRSEKESVCGFVMATDTAFKNVSLTSQEIAKLERALVDNGDYRDYERRDDVKDNYYTAMKFLKYHNKLAIPSNSSGISDLLTLRYRLSNISNVNNEHKANNIAIIRFIHGKAELQNSPYHDAFVYSMTTIMQSLNNLNNFLDFNARSNSNCVRYGNVSESSSQSKCYSYVNEIRAIKNYTESVLK